MSPLDFLHGRDVQYELQVNDRSILIQKHVSTNDGRDAKGVYVNLQQQESESRWAAFVDFSQDQKEMLGLLLGYLDKCLEFPERNLDGY